MPSNQLTEVVEFQKVTTKALVYLFMATVVKFTVLPALVSSSTRRLFTLCSVGACLLLGLGAAALAKPVSSRQAAAVVRGWLKADAMPLQERLGGRVMSVEEFKDANAGSLYFVVYLDPSGFVIVSADDLVEPIVGFAAQGRFEPSPKNPLGALVSNDLPGRIAKARALGVTAPKGALLEAQGKWRKLEKIDQGNTLTAMGIGTVSDIRVPPFVQTRWSQSVAGGSACWNYYTPPNGAGDYDNYPCGCSATAMAQLMRYYQYPTNGIGSHSFDITVDMVPESRLTRGGDGLGGPYAWSSMPLVVNSSTTAEQRQAMGAVTFDAGITLNMDYASDGSASDTMQAKDAFTTIFGYSSARKGYNDSYNIGAGLTGMLNPNLDAKYPVLLGIRGGIGGHAVVCDGYGYNLSTLYHHLNLGWAGTDNAWYALPTIDTVLGTFDSVVSSVYNVYISGSGEIISGRVVSGDGLPLAGATVTATRTGGGNYTASTDTNGIYALAKIPSSSSYQITATKTGYDMSLRTVSTGSSTDFNATSGNAWGADFTLRISSSGPPVILQDPLGVSAMVGDTVTFSVLAVGSAPLHYQWQVNLTDLSGQTSSNLVLTGVSLAQAGDYRVIITNAYGSATSTVARLNIDSKIDQVYAAPGLITIPNSIGAASPYPSTINVTGLGGVLVKVSVTISNFSHTWPDDVDMLLVSPGGQKVLLMANAGYGYSLNGINLTFDDSAPGYLAQNSLIVSGTYRPSPYAADVLPSPAPSGPYAKTLSAFNETDPNGDWKLFVADDSSGDAGNIAGGWSLRLITVAQGQQVHHFTWGTITSPEPANMLFPVSITAKDSAEHTLTNYAGSVFTAAWSGVGSETNKLLGTASWNYYNSGGSFTDGYSFTPNIDIVVTHVRHYYGEKVSIWTDDGTILASQPVVSVPQTWVETPLAKPVLLRGGTRYRIGVFYAASSTTSYCRLDMGGTFKHGTLDQGYYSTLDRCPTNVDNARWYFVDLRYGVRQRVLPDGVAGFSNGVCNALVSVDNAATNMVLYCLDFLDHAGISNPFNTATSGVPPMILTQPRDQAKAVGATVVFTVSASGSMPLYFTWIKDSTIVSQGTNNFFRITDLQKSDAGLYWAVVTNNWGSVTSAAVTLQVTQLQFAHTPGSLQMSNGVFQMQLHDISQPGSLVLEASTNLVSWTPIFTNTLATNVLFYSDPKATNYPWRFYRAREP